MNIEIERKFKINNYQEIKQKVFDIGAELKNKSSNKDIYFKVPQEVENTKYLRIRIKNNETSGTLAYHEVVSDLETKEWETNISDAGITSELIEKLGFEIDAIVDKARETFKMKNVEIVIDKVKNLGSFIEIEASNEKTLEEIRKKLNIPESDVVSGCGYPDLLKKKYGKNKH